MRLPGGITLITTVLLALSVQARADTTDTNENKRLIKTSPQSQTWMTSAEIDQLMRSIRSEGRFGGFMDITDFPEKHRISKTTLAITYDSEPKMQDTVQALIEHLSPQKLHDNIAKLSSYQNRYYQSESGIAAAMWIYDQFSTLARGRTDVTVELVKHNFKQPSVIARIKGNSPKKSVETIIIGGHEDSISTTFGIPSPSANAPGADDNASGIATMLEVFRVLMESGFSPERTMEFIAYAGEERGLLGSQAIAQTYARSAKQVAGVLQLDMTMYPGQEQEIALITDETDPNLTQFVKMLIDTYVKVPWQSTTCGYACSDHASWTEAGYPSVYPFESAAEDYNPKIHTPNDRIDILDISFGMNFAKLALSFAIELT
jgi:leucyl aminopeptidase